MPSYSHRNTKSGTVYDVRFRIIDENGMEMQKRLSGYPTKRAAQQAYIDFMKTYIPPTFTLPKNSRYIYDDLLELYKKRMKTELAASSVYDLLTIFDRFITPYFKEKSLPTLKKADYVAWQTELWAKKNPRNGEPYSQKYLTKIRSVFITFLSWCEETFDIPNLMRTIKKPKRKEMKKEMLFWEMEEFLKFQDVVDDVLWKTFFTSLFYSGCRIGELTALSDNDVVLSNGNYQFIINKTLTRKTGQQNESYLISPPKTSTSNRTITLPDVMTDIIQEYLAYKKQNNISDKFFFGGDVPIAERTYQRYFAHYTELAGLKRIRIHDLRHSHASMLIHLGTPITIVSKRLGHSSIKMTLERYSHCYEEEDKLAISAINNAIKN